MTSYSVRVFDVVMTSLSFININTFFLPTSNASVPIVLVAIFLLFILLVVFARKLDIHDLAKLRPVPLIDNAKTDQHKYYVTVETGFGRSAGTTAKVRL